MLQEIEKTTARFLSELVHVAYLTTRGISWCAAGYSEGRLFDGSAEWLGSRQIHDQVQLYTEPAQQTGCKMVGVRVTIRINVSV